MNDTLVCNIIITINTTTIYFKFDSPQHRKKRGKHMQLWPKNDSDRTKSLYL